MPYILPPNISLNSPTRTHSVDTSRPRHRYEDTRQTISYTHPHRLNHPLHTLPITLTSYNDLRDIFDTLRIANTVDSDHHQSVSLPLIPLHYTLHATNVEINRIAPSYRRLDRLLPTHHPHTLLCPPDINPINLAMPADRRLSHPLRTPYTHNRILDRAATRLLRDTNGPSPIIVQSTPAERELLSRRSAVTLPDRVAAIWPRITGQGHEFTTYRFLRTRYQGAYGHDDLFFLLDLAWNAVCEHAILESQNTGLTTAAAIAEGKSHAHHLKGLISHLYDLSWAEYRVHGARDSDEILDWPGCNALKRLLHRAFAVLAAVTALGRPYQESRVAWQDFVDRLVVEPRRSIRAMLTRPDAQALGGTIDMTPTSPIVATSSPGPDFRSALDRRIRSTRDPARSARRLPNVPSSLVDPNSPQQQLAAGNIPSSSPVQVPRQEPHSPDSPLRPRSRPAPAQSLSQEESAVSTGNDRAQSPPSSPRPEQLPPHQGASPIAPSSSDWPMDDGDDEMESIIAENGTVRSVVDSPGRASRRASSAEYMDRVAVYGVPRYHYLLAHPRHPAWDEIIPRRTPLVLRMHRSEVRRSWEMPVDEDDNEERSLGEGVQWLR